MLQMHDSRRYLSFLIMSESSEDEMVALILLVAAEKKRVSHSAIKASLNSSFLNLLHAISKALSDHQTLFTYNKYISGTTDLLFY